MTDVDLEILSRFDEVWSRVQHQAPQVEAREQSGLQGLMDGLWELECGYRQVSQGARERERKQLCRLAADIACRLSHLRLRHFLDTGEIYQGEKQVIFASSPLSNLRNLWKNAGDMTEKLQNAGEWKQLLPAREAAACIEMLQCHRRGVEEMVSRFLQ